MNVLSAVTIFLIVIIENSIICAQRISEQKCLEYSTSFPRSSKKHNRGIIDGFFANFFDIPVPNKIPTEPGEFPHMAHLGYGDGDNKLFACAGTLISDEYILTTATCTTIDSAYLQNNKRKRDTSNESSILSLFGLNNKNEEQDEDTDGDEEEEKDTEKDKIVGVGHLIDYLIPPKTLIKWIKLGNNYTGIHEFMVEKIITHPDNDNSPLHSNIALLKLDRRVNFTPDIRPACLYYKDTDLTNTTLIASGWGATAFDKLMNEQLMKIPLVTLSDEECTLPESWAEQGIIEDTQFCVGDREGNNTLCRGDEGDPLQLKNENYPDMYDVVAIAATGNMCNLMSIPVYATRVSSYILWIENIVWP